MDAQSGLAHTVIGTPANVVDLTQAADLLHSGVINMFADDGYQGVAKRKKAQAIDVNWHVTIRPSKRKALNQYRATSRLIDQQDTFNALIHAKVEHLFRVIKQQLGFTRSRDRRVANTARLSTSFAMRNLWTVR